MTSIRPEPFPDAVVILIGGRGSRLAGANARGDAGEQTPWPDAAGVDKAALAVGGMTLLERAIRAVDGCPVVVVGPQDAPLPGLVTTCEDPPGGGPAAGVAAGVQAVPTAAHRIGVLAVDQAGVTAATWRRLTAALSDRAVTGAVLADGGRRQYGVGVFSADALRRAIAARRSWHGASLRDLLDPLIGADVPAVGAESRDIDTREDLSWWRDHEAGGDGRAGQR